MSELNFACALANPNVRAAIRTHAKELHWENRIASHVVEFFTNDDDNHVGVVPDANVRAFLSNKCIDEEIEKVLRLCSESVQVGEHIGGIIKPFEGFYMRKCLASILNKEDKANRDMTPEDIISRVQQIKFVESESTPIDNLGEMDVQKILDTEQGGGALPSKFNFIQRALPMGAYMRGQLIQVVGAPGTGKSMFMVNEAVNLAKAGYKGYYIALGDLMRIDMIVRFSSVITGEDFNEVQINPMKYYNDEVKEITKNIRISVLPAGTMNPNALADLIISKIDPVEPVDYVIVDYDANFMTTSESMYAEGDVVYNAMSQIARPVGSPFRLVFIASQPKIAYWDAEELPLESAAESARKQAIVDIMVTIGKNPNIGAEKSGVMKCAKVRRGKVGMKSYYRTTNCGNMEEISDSDYSILCSTYSSNKPKKQKKPWNKSANDDD